MSFLKKLKVIIICLFITTSSAGVIVDASHIVIEESTGRIISGSAENVKVPMASTTKVLTALVVLDIEKNLNKKIIIDNRAVGVEGSSIYLEENEEITIIDLLYGLMLRSGNDSAQALAYHYGGSTEKFADLMNKKAKEIGAINSNFVNPHGLHDGNHYTTAYDLALITREAMKNDTFKQIVGTKKYQSSRANQVVFINKNKVLTQYEGGTGVKTGYTKVAGRCLVSSSTRNELDIICVVFNNYNYFADSYALMDNAHNNYTSTLIFEKDVVYSSTDKDRNYLYTFDNNIEAAIKEGEKNNVRVSLDFYDVVLSKIQKGEVIGECNVYIGEEKLMSNDIVSPFDVDNDI